MRFTPEQPLPAWAQGDRERDAFRPLWPCGSIPKGTRNESPTSYQKEPNR